MKKLAKLNGDWKWIVFSEKEELDIREKHRGNAVAIFIECLNDAKKLVGDEEGSVVLTDVACALFNKRCDAIYSVLQTALDDAIHDIQINKE